MIWPVAVLLFFVFVALKLTDAMSPESKNRRRRRKSHRPLAYRDARTTVRFS